MSFKRVALGVAGALVLTLTSGPVSALHRSELGALKETAHELAESADHVHSFAEQQAHHFNRSEQRLLVTLHRFASSAREFHATIENYFANGPAIRRTLALLNEDARAVNRSIGRSHALESVFAEWGHCRQLLGQINARLLEGPEVGLHAHQVTHGGRDDADRIYIRDGVRYPRNGDLYWTNDRWVPIHAAPEVVSDSDWYTLDGVRYRRRGNLYWRDGEWIAIPRDGRSTVKNVLRTILDNTDRD